MANDIIKSINTNNIKNGTLLVSCTKTGEYSTVDTYVNNNPTISSIESKYNDRFDDPSYYYGNGGGVDGGDVGGDVLGV